MHLVWSVQAAQELQHNDSLLPGLQVQPFAGTLQTTLAKT